jgi:aspartyl-tRNA(Asn)/glutamyl-tRNA(Gln) amidotransferase subunit C
VKITLSREEVAHVAELAKLGLTEEELEEFRQQLSSILDYAQMLTELDTDDISPTAQVIALENVMREDQVASSLSKGDVLANAPAREDDSFRVPLILD